MSPICRLRVFDLDKYQKIEPIIKSIYNKNAYPSQVAALIQEALNRIKDDSFKKANKISDMVSREYSNEFESALILVQDGRLTQWPDGNTSISEENNIEYIKSYFTETITYENYLIQQEKSSNKNSTELSTSSYDVDCDETTEHIIKLLCYSRYQSSTNNLEILPGTSVEYSDIYGDLYRFNKNLCDLLDNGTSQYPVQSLPSGWASFKILKREVVKIISDIVYKDLSNLSQTDCTLYLIQDDEGTVKYYEIGSKLSGPKKLDKGYSAIIIPDVHHEFINFYKSLSSILNVINLNSKYTLTNQVSF
jgi:hypothetical protein